MCELLGGERGNNNEVIHTVQLRWQYVCEEWQEWIITVMFNVKYLYRNNTDIWEDIFSFFLNLYFHFWNFWSQLLCIFSTFFFTHTNAVLLCCFFFPYLSSSQDFIFCKMQHWLLKQVQQGNAIWSCSIKTKHDLIGIWLHWTKTAINNYKHAGDKCGAVCTRIIAGFR